MELLIVGRCRLGCGQSTEGVQIRSKTSSTSKTSEISVTSFGKSFRQSGSRAAWPGSELGIADGAANSSCQSLDRFVLFSFVLKTQPPLCHL
jgi:hypothetical protein